MLVLLSLAGCLLAVGRVVECSFYFSLISWTSSKKQQPCLDTLILRIQISSIWPWTERSCCRNRPSPSTARRCVGCPTRKRALWERKSSPLKETRLPSRLLKSRRYGICSGISRDDDLALLCFHCFLMT